MSKILFVGCVQFAKDILKSIQEKFNVDYCTYNSREMFIEECSSKYQDVSVIYVSPETRAVIGNFDAELISYLPNALKHIVYVGAGYDMIDVSACEKRDIYVSHTPSAVDNATADISVFLILACCRNAIASNDNIRAGRFRHGVPMGTDVQGKVLGILGAGGIGRTLARRMAGFDLRKIQYYNRTRLSEEIEKEHNLVYVDFETFLATSDIISVHCPHTPETTHLLNYREFMRMKEGVIIINTARGKVINEAALVKGLESGQVYSAGLDVFEEEPKVHPGLLSHPRSVILPHMGTFTNETQYNMEKLALYNLLESAENNSLLTPVPEHRKYFNK